MRGIGKVEAHKQKGIPMPTTDVPLEELYRTTNLIDALVQIPIAPTFLRDRLFGIVQTTDADLVSIDFYRGRQKLAPFCSRYSKGIAVPREREKLSLFSPPFIKPNRMLHADDLLRRNLGGNRGNGNATNRDAELLVIDQQELDASISRTENWMCSQVLFSGKVQCRDGDTQEIVAELDYGPISRTVASVPWDDPTADPLADLKAAQRLVSGACGFTADFIVMGRLAGDAFESNAKVMESYSKLHINLRSSRQSRRLDGRLRYGALGKRGSRNQGRSRRSQARHCACFR